MDELTATLFINITSSRCGNCSKSVMPESTHHADITGWSPKPGGGCGARFINTSTDYRNITPDQLKRVRPDLPVRDN